MKQSEITCLTRNTNIKSGDENPNASSTARDKGKSSSVAANEKKGSLFTKVLKRRKSR